MGDVPQDGVVYNVVIGETVTGGGDDHYHVLQYGFKPASIDGSQEGLLRKTENGGVEVEFANPGKAPENKVCFKGQYTPCKEYECILIFDSINSTFRLERLMGQGKSLKVVRQDQTKYTTKIEVPPILEQETVFETATNPVPNRSRARTKAVEMPVAPVTASGSSPEEGSLSEGAVPAKRTRSNKKTASAPKRARKSTARNTKDVKAPEPSGEENADADDLLALVDQIESSVPVDSAKPSSQDEEEEQEDFLAAAFETENSYQPPAVEPPIPSIVTPHHHHHSHSHPANRPPIPPPKSHPPPPLHNPAFGFPAQNQNQIQIQNHNQFSSKGLPNGAAPPNGPVNGAAGGAEESDSGSDSESASDSSSASDSASDSSSESESENE